MEVFLQHLLREKTCEVRDIWCLGACFSLSAYVNSSVRLLWCICNMGTFWVLLIDKLIIELWCLLSTGKGDITNQLEQATHEANERLSTLHSLEKQSLRNALIEERSRLCLFVTGLKPVMVSLWFNFCFKFLLWCCTVCKH